MKLEGPHELSPEVIAKIAARREEAIKLGHLVEDIHGIAHITDRGMAANHNDYLRRHGVMGFGQG